MFTNEQLQAMIRREPVSDRYPYPQQDDDLLEQSLQPLLDDLTRANIRYRVASPHFGCGYASYIQIVCWTDAHVKVTFEDGERNEERRGLFLFISRLAPVAAIVNDAWQFASFNAAGEELSCGGTKPTEPELTLHTKYKPLARSLSRLLIKHGLTLLPQKYVTQRLPFPATIPTLDRESGTYLVWDAIFYWHD